MDGHNRSKVNQLMSAWPTGTVAVQKWLDKQKVSRTLADRYRQTGWLKRLGSGAYVRPNDRLEWSGAVYTLQQQTQLSVHPGGKTALQLQGYTHFVPLGKGATLMLYGSPRARLPTWFTHTDWGVRVVFTATSLFGRAADLGLTRKDFGTYGVTVSAPERAMMEVLHSVPQSESFEEARLLMEGLTTLRPSLVQNLLEACRSVKVKRLFLYLADTANHAWFKQLDVSKIDLGRGKRMLVKGGILVPRYNITVPRGSSDGTDRLPEV
jgi:hypothetical protein